MTPPGPPGATGPPGSGPPPVRGPLASPGFWLHQAALAWLHELDTRLRPLQLTHTQFTLLAAVSFLGKTLDVVPTQQQVADFAGSDRMMASKVLRVLVERGLVTRSSDPTDARILRLSSTAAGDELVRQAAMAARDVDHLFFGDDEDRAVWRAHLQTIAERKKPERSIDPSTLPPMRGGSPPPGVTDP